MPHASWLVFQDASRWIIGRVNDEGPDLHTLEETPIANEDWADRIAERLRTLGYAGEGIVLALSSRHCLSQTVMVEHAALARDRQALAYAFEAWFPLAAEDLVMDFLVDGRQALGIAVQIAVVVPLVAALEESGVVVQTICPVAVLALQHHLATWTSSGRHLVVWGNGDQIDVWLVNRGQPLQWRLVPADLTSVLRELQVMTRAENLENTENSEQALEHPDQSVAGPSQRLKLVAFEISDEIRQAMTQVPTFELVEVASVVSATAAASAADKILTGKSVPCFDFRRGALAPLDPYRPVRRAIRFTLSAAFVSTLVLIIALLVRAERFARETRRSQSEQTRLFEQCLPGQAVPVGIQSRLESEYVKLAGLTGESTLLPLPVDSLTTLYDLLTSLPDDLPYRLLELRLDKERIHLECELSSHGDADRIGAALRRGGFDVDPPHSQQLANGRIFLRMDASIPES